MVVLGDDVFGGKGVLGVVIVILVECKCDEVGEIGIG